jgi:hypothetical protein
MAVPDGWSPYVTSARRYYWLREQSRSQDTEYGASAVWRATRLEAVGTALWFRVPGRSLLEDAGILALEEVIGAGVEELREYGLRRSTAEALINFCEGVVETMTVFQIGPRAGQIYDQDEVTLISSETYDESFETDAYEVGDRPTLRLDLDVTAISGSSAKLHVQIETRKDDDDDYRVADAFIAVTAVSAQRRVVAGLDRYVKVVCTISGSTPSVTFSLDGEAV